MLELRPFENLSQLQKSAEQIWQSLTKTDWLEAFSHHPRIGGVATSTWASQEQKGAAGASEEILRKLADGNTAYEKRFGHIFLVCATGKSAGEMLQLLEQRLGNAPEPELRIAVGEQAKITRIRLEKLFS
jgi:2-oxo-4-hydroxy-4-carboxy-5-ureidoimidazoline decarboxylase